MSQAASLQPLHYRLHVIGIFARHPVHPIGLRPIRLEAWLDRIHDPAEAAIGQAKIAR